MIRSPLRSPDGTARLTVNPTGECVVCHKPFFRFNTMQIVCSPAHGLKYAQSQRIAETKAEKAKARVERAQTKARKEAIKTRREWMDECQTLVNRYVRLRDVHLGCVSCDKPASWGGQWHASHFRSVGAASAVRFHLWNIHKACSVCNNWKSGNLSEYEPSLRARIGNEKVDWLRNQNQLADYSVDYLKRLKRVFAKKARRMEARLKGSM